MASLGSFFELLLAPVQALSGAERIAGTLAAVARALMDGRMWRSFGWIVLGMVLMGIAIWMLIKPHLTKSAGQAAQVAQFAALA
jgi:hypothetical protein